MLDSALESFNSVVESQYKGDGLAPFFKCHSYIMKSFKIGNFRECHIYISYNVPKGNQLESLTVLHFCHKAAVDYLNIDSLRLKTEMLSLTKFIDIWDKNRNAIIKGTYNGPLVDWSE